jgi:hypothetical protein
VGLQEQEAKKDPKSFHVFSISHSSPFDYRKTARIDGAGKGWYAHENIGREGFL